MIHAASKFAEMARAATPGGAHGIKLSAPPSLDLAETVAWKDGIVGKPEQRRHRAPEALEGEGGEGLGRRSPTPRPAVQSAT